MTKTKAFLQKHRWSLTGALLGALVFLVLYGVRVLDPVCVDWILNNPSPDPSQHYLGWVFYRRSGWHLPYLGANYSAIYPYRTSILYTDSIPLLAVVCKLLGGVLPARFQYLGLWGLFCYAMQGGLARALIARIGGVRPQDTAKNWASVLGAGVLVLFPALNIRMFAHTALAANWLVLLAGSNSIMVTSTSFRLAAAVWVIRASSLLRAAWMPGVSISTYCTGPLVITPVMRLRVVCGFWVTIATFSPTR